MQVSTDNVAGQLILCGSEEIQTSLQRILGVKLYEKTEVDLLEKMKNLLVRYQNPAVYVEEFLTMKQEGDENIIHYLSRLKGVSNRCEFLVTCTCCGDGNRNDSYADDITKRQGGE